MILLSQWYEPPDADRLAELTSVRKANESSGLFEQTIYLDGKERLSFGRFFDYAAEHHRGEVCVVANTDILFDETAKLIPSCCKPNRLVALTRWEPPYLSPRMIGHSVGDKFFSGSQDVWCVVGGGLPRWLDVIPLGEVGCDQAVVGWAASSRQEVVNPSLSIKTLHVHRSPPNHAPGCVTGLYGYPEPTIAARDCRGLVLVHPWPFEEGQHTGEIVATCRP